MQHLRAYVLHIASNLWMTRLRRRETHGRAIGILEQAEGREAPWASQGAEVRQAAERMLGTLSPQGRAALG